MSLQPIPCEKLTLERSTWPPWCWTSHCLAVGPRAGLFCLILVSLPENRRLGQIRGFLDSSAERPWLLGTSRSHQFWPELVHLFIDKTQIKSCGVLIRVLERVAARRQPLRASANSSFYPPKRCHWSDMFTGRLRSEIPPALVSRRGHCSPGQRGPCFSSQVFYLTPSLWRSSCVPWATEMLKSKPSKHSICPVF